MIFAEFNMKGSQHLLVNAGFIECFSENEENIYLFADKFHRHELFSLVKNPKIKYFSIPVLKSGGLFRAIVKTSIECFLYIFLICYGKIKKEQIFILSAYASTKRFIELLSSIFRQPVFLVHHGELNALAEKKTRYSKFVLSYFKKRRSKFVKDVFLSSSIEKALHQFQEKKFESLCVLHPFPKILHKKNIITNGKRSRRVKLGYFGSLNSVNKDRLQSIIDALNTRVLNNKEQDFEFSLVCPNPYDFNLHTLKPTFIIDTIKMIPLEEYNRIIKWFDLIILPYLEEQYNYVASGVVVDCLLNNIDFITTSSNFFNDWLFRYPESGKLFNTFAQLTIQLADPNFEFNL